MNKIKFKGNFFIDKERIRTIDAYRIVYFIGFIFFLVLTEVGRYIYRPYIYENNINDYGIADSMGNWGGIIVQLFFGLTIFNSARIKGLRLIAFFVLGYVVYEILQLFLPRGTFDFKDVYGTIIGGFIGMFLFLLIHKVVKKNTICYKF